MKKTLWTTLVLILCLVSLCITMGGCKRHQKLDSEDIEKIIGPGGELDSETATEFISLFNEATYKRELDFGTTPTPAFTVCFQDGSKLYVEVYSGYYLWVHGENTSEGDYFIESEALHDLFNELYKNAQ